MNRIAMLRVKIKSLADEARTIRVEERRVYADRKNPHREKLLSSLREHRVRDVRAEARHALLAYGFLRGQRYAELEKNPRVKPDWDRVGRLVAKFGAVEGANSIAFRETCLDWAAGKEVVTS